MAGLFHETHTFVPQHTVLADFSIRRGKKILDRLGDGSTIDGFLEVAASKGWDVVPIVDYTALPAGTVEQEVLDSYWSELETGLRDALSSEKGLDGIWLALHGAMVTTECEDPEGELLSRMRQHPGAENLPLFGVFDLHATFTGPWRNMPMVWWPIAKTLTRMRAKPPCGRATLAGSSFRGGHDSADDVAKRADHVAADGHRHGRPPDARS